MAKTFYVDCPECGCLIEVSAESGKVVEKWSKEQRDQSADDKMSSALKKIQDDKKRRKSLFEDKKGELDGQKEKLADAFEKEVQKVKKKGLGDKPFRPFDLD